MLVYVSTLWILNSASSLLFLQANWLHQQSQGAMSSVPAVCHAFFQFHFILLQFSSSETLRFLGTLCV